MNHTIDFRTDTATLAIFDVEVLKHRTDQAGDWWCIDLSLIEEVRDGRVAALSIGGDGSFRLRITTGDLSRDEVDYATVRASVGLEVVSGRIFVGAGEEIPAGGVTPAPSATDLLGSFVALSPGLYDLDVYGIDWFESPKFWNDGYLRPSDAPPDIVAVVRPRTEDFVPPPVEPRLENDESTFLFPSESRVVGPIPGLVLATEVWKREGELTLKTCGPLNYKPITGDLTGVNWRDNVSVRVLSVDQENESMRVELVKPIGPGRRWWEFWK